MSRKLTAKDNQIFTIQDGAANSILIISFEVNGHKLFFLTSENTAYISDRRWCVRNQDYSLKISNFN